MGRHFLLRFVFVGIGFLYLPQQPAQAATLPPPSSLNPCSAVAGIGEVNAIAGCISSPDGFDALAQWPPSGVTGSGVAGQAYVDIKGNQNIQVGATVSQDNAPTAEASAIATLTYYVQINPNGLPGSGSNGVTIPIMASSTSKIGLLGIPFIGVNAYNTASTTLTIQTAGSPFEADNQALNSAISSSSQIDLVSGVAYMITMTADAYVYNEVDSVSADIDPYFSFVNSADALQYEIDFSPGITNGVPDTGVSATPLPAALPLFATSLGALGLLGWRRRRKNSLAVAAA
jgi:LPXTG-motif cell wall-anchored protein